MIDQIALWGLLAGMALLWVCNWGLTQTAERHERQIEELKAKLRYKKELEEDRCCFCKDQTTCPAFDTGVLYPCPHFKEE